MQSKHQAFVKKLGLRAERLQRKFGVAPAHRVVGATEICSQEFQAILSHNYVKVIKHLKCINLVQCLVTDGQSLVFSICFANILSCESIQYSPLCIFISRIDLYELSKLSLGLKIFQCPVQSHSQSKIRDSIRIKYKLCLFLP